MLNEIVADKCSIERGEQGTPENDWFEAENFLRETIV